MYIQFSVLCVFNYCFCKNKLVKPNSFVAHYYELLSYCFIAEDDSCDVYPKMYNFLPRCVKETGTCGGHLHQALDYLKQN